MANPNGLVFPTEEELRKMTKRERTFCAARIIREADGIRLREVDPEESVVFSTESLNYAVKQGQFVPEGLDDDEAFVARYGFELGALRGYDEELPVGELVGFVLAEDQRRRRSFDPTDYDFLDKEGCFTAEDDLFASIGFRVHRAPKRSGGYSYSS